MNVICLKLYQVAQGEKSLRIVNTKYVLCMHGLDLVAFDYNVISFHAGNISASKFIMRRESTRDHADLLLSSRHWPLVYAVDMACDLVAHIEAREPIICGETGVVALRNLCLELLLK